MHHLHTPNVWLEVTCRVYRLSSLDHSKRFNAAGILQVKILLTHQSCSHLPGRPVRPADFKGGFDGRRFRCSAQVFTAAHPSPSARRFSARLAVRLITWGSEVQIQPAQFVLVHGTGTLQVNPGAKPWRPGRSHSPTNVRAQLPLRRARVPSLLVPRRFHDGPATAH